MNIKGTRGHTLRLKKKQSVRDVRRYFFSQRVVNRWLDKIRRTRMGFFYKFCMICKALGLMEIGPP